MNVTINLSIDYEADFLLLPDSDFATTRGSKCYVPVVVSVISSWQQNFPRIGDVKGELLQN